MRTAIQIHFLPFFWKSQIGISILGVFPGTMTTNYIRILDRMVRMINVEKINRDEVSRARTCATVKCGYCDQQKLRRSWDMEKGSRSNSISVKIHSNGLCVICIGKTVSKTIIKSEAFKPMAKLIQVSSYGLVNICIAAISYKQALKQHIFDPIGTSSWSYTPDPTFDFKLCSNLCWAAQKNLKQFDMPPSKLKEVPASHLMYED